MKKAILMTALLAFLLPSFLSSQTEEKAAEAQKAQVIAEKAEIFLEASQHSIVIDTIPRGTTVSLFPSGNKSKKWLYISYLSKKRNSQVTGFIDSNKVEMIEETAEKPEEKKMENELSLAFFESQKADPDQSAGEENAARPENETQELKQELENLKSLLQKMENENQEKKEVARADTNPEQEQKAEEPTAPQTVKSNQREKKPVADESVKQEKGGPKKAVGPGQTLPAFDKPASDKEESAENDAAPQNLQKNNGGKTAPDKQKSTSAEKPKAETAPNIKKAQPTKVLTKVAVTVPRANIRLMPTTKSSVISRVSSGTELKPLAKTGNWYRVNLSPNKEGIVLSGYIHHSIVSEIFESVVPPPPEPEKIPEKEPEVIEEETESDPEPIQQIPSRRTPGLGEYLWVGGGAGYTMPSETHFKKGMNITGTFGFGLMKHLAVELRVPYFQSDVASTAGGLSAGRLNNLSLMLSVQARYPLKNQFVPYLVAGGDYHLNRFNLNEEVTNSWNNQGYNIKETVDHTFGFHFGAGLDVFLMQNIALNLDVRYYTAGLKGSWTLAKQNSQETTSGTIENMTLNSIQAGISVKLFLNPLRRK